MKFVADDGTIFASRADCQMYENDLALECLCGLTVEGLRSGLRYENVVIARALERAGVLAGVRRRAKGIISTRGGHRKKMFAAG